ncbi:Site-specific recombinase XerD [Corchorus olitorius]|uniref:Site-specific recombinase XerD n=1 Tax=Corchorus olitorius TaxID=93759 RepID=A0A1R3IWW8_9ROSI|nr:Site-specific recombinase XerD [Corchorus olitorius]
MAMQTTFRRIKVQQLSRFSSSSTRHTLAQRSIDPSIPTANHFTVQSNGSMNVTIVLFIHGEPDIIT